VLVSGEWDEPTEAWRRAALGDLLARHRDRLRLMVRLRLDQRLKDVLAALPGRPRGDDA
jgi:hypothetical protein